MLSFTNQVTIPGQDPPLLQAEPENHAVTIDGLMLYHYSGEHERETRELANAPTTSWKLDLAADRYANPGTRAGTCSACRPSPRRMAIYELQEFTLVRLNHLLDP